LKGEINLSKKILQNLYLGARTANPERNERTRINISKHQSGYVWRPWSKCTPSKREDEKKENSLFFAYD